MKKKTGPVIGGLVSGAMAFSMAMRSPTIDCLRTVDLLLLLAAGFAFGAAIVFAVAGRRS